MAKSWSTARRVEEKLKDVLLPVAAFDASTIEAAGITNLLDMASLKPDGGIDPRNRMELRERTDAWSVCGSMDFELTDAWQARVELRYSQEHQDNRNFAYARCGEDIDTFPFNKPSVDECGDDFWGLRAVDPEAVDKARNASAR